MKPQSKEHLYEVLETFERKFAQSKPQMQITLCDPQADLEGYLVIWNTVDTGHADLGRCAKGGTRITPTLSLDEVTMLAKAMALKNAAAGLPLGGGKSGLRADPRAPSFERTYRRFVQLMRPLLSASGGPYGGFGFDIGADPIQAIWACDELGSTQSFTGKAVEMGGTDYDRQGIAGLGVAVAAKTVLEFFKKDPSGTTFSIQGLGNMGAAVYRYFTEYGGILHAVADPRLGGTYCLDKPVSPELHRSLILQNFQETTELLGKEGACRLDLKEIISQTVDIFFPCAVQDVISSKNADGIQAKYVVEGANGPSSDEAKSKLFRRGITVIPDFIANPGGIIAAYVELTSPVTVSENARSQQKVLEAKQLTTNKISQNVSEILNLASRFKVEPTHVARFFALSNIFEREEMSQSPFLEKRVASG